MTGNEKRGKENMEKKSEMGSGRDENKQAQ
jgi:hypothetical protein